MQSILLQFKHFYNSGKPCFPYFTAVLRIRIRWIRKILAEKLCGSTDPDPSGKISTKNCKKKLFYSWTQIWTFKNKRDYKNFLISEWFIKFYLIERTEKIKKFNFFCLKNLINLNEMTRIHFFQCGSRIHIHIKIQWSSFQFACKQREAVNQKGKYFCF